MTFQYITCYSLSIYSSPQSQIILCFNTSHVTLYLDKKVYKQVECCFNTSHVTLYRPRLLKHLRSWGCFNTSHVTLYLYAYSQSWGSSCVSIHHMLLFIEEAIQAVEQFRKFQYITCYSLSLQPAWYYTGSSVSIHHMLLFISIHHPKRLSKLGFNTSHVTLYRWMLMLLCKTISSFNTSHVTLYQEAARRHVIWLMFQYITCYSLSRDRMKALMIALSFNTSHVTLYPSFYRDFIHPHV